MEKHWKSIGKALTTHEEAQEKRRKRIGRLGKAFEHHSAVPGTWLEQQIATKQQQTNKAWCLFIMQSVISSSIGKALEKHRKRNGKTKEKFWKSIGQHRNTIRKTSEKHKQGIRKTCEKHMKRFGKPKGTHRKPFEKHRYST